MDDSITQSILDSYDRIADEYARQLFNELERKPLFAGDRPSHSMSFLHARDQTLTN